MRRRIVVIMLCQPIKSNTQTRYFCTQINSNIKASLPPLKVKSFGLTPEQAVEKWEAWGKNHFLAPVGTLTRTQPQPIGVWLPFFTYDVTATSIFSAQVRCSYTAGGWREIRSKPSSYHYSCNLPDMQVYANHTQKFDHVQVVKGQLEGAKLFSDLEPEEVFGKEFERFEMHRSLARSSAFACVQVWEEERGRKLLRSQFEGFQQFGNKLTLDFTNQPIFFPCYIVDFTRLGRVFRSVVNGVSGEVWGQTHYSALKVGTAVGFPVVAGLALQSGLSHVPTAALAGCVAGAGLAGFAAGFFPFYKQYMREVRRINDKAQNDAFGTKAQEASYNLRYTPHAPAAGQQAKGHYRLLGVTQTAQLNEIQRAFRTQSFKWHPDVHSGQETEAHAHIMYRDIIAAYQVLRCPNKRRIYDTSDAP